MFARAAAFAVALGSMSSAVGAQEPPVVPTPVSHFGFTPGEDRRLADWNELSAYYDAVARTSPRVAIDTLGSTTRGRPLVMLTITSPANHERLEEIRETHLRLADPRRIESPEELERLKADARVIALITSHIHSTEVGAGQMPANLVHRLATSEDPEIAEVLDRVVLLLIPSLNPDGTQLVSEWYRRWVGTPFEGSEPVELYHPYVGHDDNRDWYAFTQVETQLVVEKAHNAWRPMIVHDVHQMGQTGARLFVPPYVDPFEPNVDPLLVAAINRMGSSIAADLTLQGKPGVVTGAQFDLFSPSRAYSHYHGGVRILSETASARLATPIDLQPEDLVEYDGTDFSRPTVNHPMPWRGGRWGLPEIVDYQQSAALALLRNAARDRAFWIDTFYEVNRRATEGRPEWPRFWVIPDGQENETGLNAVLRILTMGSVEVHRAEAPFLLGERTFPSGTYVIPMRQPYASWAQALLETQTYPATRQYANGPPVRPYDVTAHTLPLLMGVEAIPVYQELVLDLSDPLPVVEVKYDPPEGFTTRRAPRIAIYKGWREPITAGWTRWLLDQHGIAYDTLHNAQIRRGGLRFRHDVIIFQDQPYRQIVDGWRAGEVPAEYAGGIGYEGLEALREFVRSGGRLIAIEGATDLALELFPFPITNRVATLPSSRFFIPGAILRLDLANHAITSRLGRESIAWFGRASRAFDVFIDPSIRVVARYGTGDPTLSGWTLGTEHIAGQPAIIEARVGRGSVVLFGFQPNYRGHSIATWPLLFNAIR